MDASDSSQNNIYEICKRCDHGKIHGLDKKDKIIIIVTTLILLIPLFFVFQASMQIAALKFANKTVPLKSPLMLQLVISGSIFVLLAWISHYYLKVINKIKSWFNKTCPYCKDGYVIKNRANAGQTIVYFLDLFIFEQILLPMYKTLTFQKFWKNETKEKLWVVASKLCFYLFLFFGSIPFLIFLLGSNKIKIGRASCRERV